MATGFHSRLLYISVFINHTSTLLLFSLVDFDCRSFYTWLIIIQAMSDESILVTSGSFKIINLRRIYAFGADEVIYVFYFRNALTLGEMHFY